MDLGVTYNEYKMRENHERQSGYVQRSRKSTKQSYVKYWDLQHHMTVDKNDGEGEYG